MSSSAANTSAGFAGAIREGRKVPSKTERQRKMMGADLARKRAGKPTKTGMSAAQLRDYAKKPVARKKK